MDKLTSILAVMDPADEARHVLTKAVVLARHFRARLELFLCDSEQDFVLRHSYDPAGALQGRQACLADGQRYLDALRRTVAEDVLVSTHVACESPLYEAIVRRVDSLRPDLVIKGAAGRHPLRRLSLDANDWMLARSCPAPLFLTRGRPWSAAPRFAAALDIDDAQGTGLPRRILQAAGYLAQGCRASLDVVYSDPSPEGAGKRADRLGRLVREFSIGDERMEVLHGEPESTLPDHARGRDYDLVVMGALTRKPALSALVGTLTSTLVDALDCDFVLVKNGGKRKELGHGSVKSGSAGAEPAGARRHAPPTT